MSPTVRSILLPSATSLAAVAQRARVALAHWAAEWTIGGGSDCGAPRVEAQAIESDATLGAPEFECVPTKAGALWFRRNAADLASLGRAVVGAALMPGGTWADESVADIVEHAWVARNRAITAALVNSEPAEASLRGTLPESIFKFGAGSVYFYCELIGLHAVADQSIWSAISPSERTRTARAKLTPLDEAVRKPTTRIDVMLGTVELDLSNVLDLRPGDVLRLPQRLDEALSVLCEGQPLAHAALGERDGRIGVQLTSRSATPEMRTRL